MLDTVHTDEHVHSGEIIPISRAQVIANFTKKIPLNDYGLPRFLYRTDLIPNNILSKEPFEQEEILSSSALLINYHEGFPAFDDSKPIWYQLGFEGDSAFSFFHNYLIMQEETGVRQLTALEYSSNAVEGSLLDFFHMNYWKFRAKAYDLFVTAMHEKRRLQRMMKCEDDQYILAENLIKKCATFFEGMDWETMDPGVVARFIPQLTEIQRRALGISMGPKGANGNEPSRAASLELIIKNISVGADPDSEGGQDLSSQSLDILLDDPEVAKIAQELIVKMQGTQPVQIDD